MTALNEISVEVCYWMKFQYTDATKILSSEKKSRVCEILNGYLCSLNVEKEI